MIDAAKRLAMRVILHVVISVALLVGATFATTADAQVLFDGTHFVTGGQYANTSLGDQQSFTAFWRVTSGGGDSNGIVNYLLNDARSFNIQALDYGGGINQPIVSVGGQDPYGNPDWMQVTIYADVPNDNNFHTFELQVIESGGSPYGLPLLILATCHLDGSIVPAVVSHTPNDLLNMAIDSGGNWYIGFNSTVGISRVSVYEGAQVIDNSSAPISVYGGYLDYNEGFGNGLLMLPDYEVNITIDQCGPGC